MSVVLIYILRNFNCLNKLNWFHPVMYTYKMHESTDIFYFLSTYISFICVVQGWLNSHVCKKQIFLSFQFISSTSLSLNSCDRT